MICLHISFFCCNFAAQNEITDAMPKIFELIMDNGILVEIRVHNSLF